MYKTCLKILQQIQVSELTVESPETGKMNIAVGKDCRKCWRVVERYTFACSRTRAECCSAPGSALMGSLQNTVFFLIAALYLVGIVAII